MSACFDYREGRIRCRRLMRSLHTTPQLITLTEEMREMDETKRDEAFLRVAQESLKGISYLRFIWSERALRETG